MVGFDLGTSITDFGIGMGKAKRNAKQKGKKLANGAASFVKRKIGSQDVDDNNDTRPRADSDSSNATAEVTPPSSRHGPVAKPSTPDASSPTIYKELAAGAGRFASLKVPTDIFDEASIDNALIDEFDGSSQSKELSQEEKYELTSHKKILEGHVNDARSKILKTKADASLLKAGRLGANTMSVIAKAAGKDATKFKAFSAQRDADILGTAVDLTKEKDVLKEAEKKLADYKKQNKGNFLSNSQFTKYEKRKGIGKQYRPKQTESESYHGHTAGSEEELERARAETKANNRLKLLRGRGAAGAVAHNAEIMELRGQVGGESTHR